MPLDARTVQVGHELSPLDKGAITKDMLKEYGPAAGDPNPMHVDDEFAKNAGYAGVFAHGMLSMGYLGEFLVKLTWPGDVITCKGTVTAVHDEGGARVVDFDIWTETQTGERKVVGSATLALPR